MLIEVVIPTLNSEKTVKQCLKTADPVEQNSNVMVKFIIIDGGSSDNTLEIAKSFGAKIYHNKRVPHTIGSSRNLGILKATGDYVVFLDSDELVDRNWLNEIRLMISQGYKLITGQIIPIIRNNYEKFYHNLRSLVPQKKEEYIDFIPRPIRCCETNLAKQIQFDPNLQIGEDFDFTYRAFNTGNVLIYNPNLIIYHILPKKLGQMLLKEVKYGKGIMNLFYKHRTFPLLKYCLQSHLYTISPIFYHRIILQGSKLKLREKLNLVFLGFLKSIMIFSGYLLYPLNRNSAYRKAIR